MTREEFEKLVEEEFPRAVREEFHHLIHNCAFLVEDEHPTDDLLGLYHGIPTPVRGDLYGVGPTLPDTITLYQLPIEEEAKHILRSQKGQTEGKTWPSGPERAPDGLFGEAVRKIVRATLWHDVAHHFGFDEEQVRRREDERGLL